VNTLDDFFEILCMIKTFKTARPPIYLIGSQFWNSLFDWVRRTFVAAGTVYPEELDYLVIVDSVDEARQVFARDEKLYAKLIRQSNGIKTSSSLSVYVGRAAIQFLRDLKKAWR